VLAYSGGLDTSFLVPWLKDNYGRPIITVTVDTGGIDAAGAKTLAERSKAYGAIAHHQIDARADYFEQVLALPDHRQRASRPALSTLRGRRARHAGAADRADGAQARHEFHCARLHGRGQRPGALRSRHAHARAGTRSHRAGA
jgi:PP-loop superfamily ATP-utilizing enzyme